ncbi:MAG: hypothetical protein NVSMB27_46400 [Ktedonobacteraceae bacterium]
MLPRVFPWHFHFMKVQTNLCQLPHTMEQRKAGVIVDPTYLVQEQVRGVANDRVDALYVWIVEDSSDIRAHIACRHRYVHTYRGYMLYSDSSERTFLLDMRTWTYVAVSNTYLLQIDGVHRAKKCIDALCDLHIGF